jgi:polysaccharide biosynthesis transport protein
VNVPASAAGEVELIDYLRVLARWKWLIVAGTLAVVVVVFVIGANSPRAYQASVAFLVTESKIPRPEAVDTVRPGVMPPETFEAIIKNQSIALEAIRHFGLDKAPLALTPESFLASHLSLKSSRGTNLITLTATFPSPQLAADVANFVAQKAVELNARLNQTDTLSAKEYIQLQRDEAKKAMDDQQAVLLDFKRSANLESLRVEQKILLDAKQRLDRLLSDYTIQIRGLQADVVGLRQALAKQERLLTLTKSVFQDPAMLAATQERGAADLNGLSSIQLKSEEINSVYQTLQSDLITNEISLTSTENQRQDVERKIKDIDNRLVSIGRRIADADAQLEDLTRNHVLAKTAYELFAKKFNEASLSVASRITDLKIVDPALVPLRPVSRRVVQTTAMAAAISLMALIVVAFFLEYLRAARGKEVPLG